MNESSGYSKLPDVSQGNTEGSRRGGRKARCHYFMMGSEVVDFLLGSRELKQIEMHHPNASLLSILTPHYWLAPETHLMEHVFHTVVCLPSSYCQKEMRMFSSMLKSDRKK